MTIDVDKILKQRSRDNIASMQDAARKGVYGAHSGLVAEHMRSIDQVRPPASPAPPEPSFDEISKRGRTAMNNLTNSIVSEIVLDNAEPTDD